MQTNNSSILPGGWIGMTGDGGNGSWSSISVLRMWNVRDAERIPCCRIRLAIGARFGEAYGQGRIRVDRTDASRYPETLFLAIADVNRPDLNHSLWRWAALIGNSTRRCQPPLALAFFLGNGSANYG
jgi:hypothetical protein